MEFDIAKTRTGSVAEHIDVLVGMLLEKRMVSTTSFNDRKMVVINITNASKAEPADTAAVPWEKYEAMATHAGIDVKRRFENGEELWISVYKARDIEDAERIIANLTRGSM